MVARTKPQITVRSTKKTVVKKAAGITICSGKVSWGFMHSFLIEATHIHPGT